MRAPTLGSEVLILDKPKGSPVDDRRWTVWSQSPTGWHLFRRDDQGGGRSRLARHARSAPATRSQGGE